MCYPFSWNTSFCWSGARSGAAQSFVLSVLSVLSGVKVWCGATGFLVSLVGGFGAIVWCHWSAGPSVGVWPCLLWCYGVVWCHGLVWCAVTVWSVIVPWAGLFLTPWWSGLVSWFGLVLCGDRARLETQERNNIEQAYRNNHVLQSKAHRARNIYSCQGFKASRKHKYILYSKQSSRGKDHYSYLAMKASRIQKCILSFNQGFNKTKMFSPWQARTEGHRIIS